MLHLKLKSESANKDLPILYAIKFKYASTLSDVGSIEASPINGKELLVEVSDGNALLYSDAQATQVIGVKATLTKDVKKIYIRGDGSSTIYLSDVRHIEVLVISQPRISDKLSADIRDLKFAYNLNWLDAQFNTGLTGDIYNLTYLSKLKYLNLYGCNVVGDGISLRGKPISTLHAGGCLFKFDLSYIASSSMIELKGLPLNTIGDLSSLPSSTKQIVADHTIRKIVCTDLMCSSLSYVALPEMDDLSVKIFTEKAALKSWTGSVCNLICQNDRGVLDREGNIVDSELLSNIEILKSKGVKYKLNGVLR